MDDEQEFTESGDRIYRHQSSGKPFEFAIGDPAAIETIGRHIAAHLGDVITVLHELVSHLVHLDVHIIEPTEDRNIKTLVTTGMSDRPMTVPEGLEEFRYAELMMCLPPDWPLNDESFKDEANYWPVRLLKDLARLPHEHDTWLGWGHSIPNGDPALPYASNTQFCGALLISPLSTPEGFERLEINPDKVVHFYSVIPLYKKEMDLKLAEGTEALLGRFDEHDISEALDVTRPNVARKRFWPF